MVLYHVRILVGVRTGTGSLVDLYCVCEVLMSLGISYSSELIHGCWQPLSSSSLGNVEWLPAFLRVGIYVKGMIDEHIGGLVAGLER